MKISHAADYCCSYGYEIIKWAGYWPEQRVFYMFKYVYIA